MKKIKPTAGNRTMTPKASHIMYSKLINMAFIKHQDSAWTKLLAM